MYVKVLTLTVLLVFSAAMAVASPCSESKVNYGQGAATFDVSEYHPAETPLKSILIIPPTGGTNLIDRNYAENFCKRGYDVYLVNDWPRPGEVTTDLEGHEHFYDNAESAIETVVAKVKTPYVGILGTSVGALHAAVAATKISRLNAAFFIVGGLPLAEVIVTSDQQAMQDLRAVRRGRYHFKSDTENIVAIDRVLPIEPTKKPKPTNKAVYGAVVSTNDTTVPYKTQLQLKDFFQPEKVISFNSSHFWAIVKTWLFHSNEVLDFFDQSASKNVSR